MAQNAAVDRNAGAGGFDWAIHQYDTAAADDDMMINNNLGGLPIQLVVNRDRWQETEADSGGPLNDTSRATTACWRREADRQRRLRRLRRPRPGRCRPDQRARRSSPRRAVAGHRGSRRALSASGSARSTGPVWGEGDILLGGGGSDTLEGRGGTTSSTATATSRADQLPHQPGRPGHRDRHAPT